MNIGTTSARYLSSSALGGGITFVLLLVMHYAIQTEETQIEEPEPGPTLAMNLQLKDIDPQVEDPLPPKPPEVPPEPPLPKLKFVDDTNTGFPGPTVITPPVIGVKPTPGIADGEMLPIVTVPPEYPNRAAARGIEGWVIVEFSVDELGRVKAPRVIEAYPSSLFDRSALNAVKRYKYKPRVVNGQALPVHGVRQRIVFNLSA